MDNTTAGFLQRSELQQKFDHGVELRDMHIRKHSRFWIAMRDLLHQTLIICTHNAEEKGILNSRSIHTFWGQATRS
jgi:hypothetical protein